MSSQDDLIWQLHREAEKASEEHLALEARIERLRRAYRAKDNAYAAVCIEYVLREPVDPDERSRVDREHQLADDALQPGDLGGVKT